MEKAIIGNNLFVFVKIILLAWWQNQEKFYCKNNKIWTIAPTKIFKCDKMIFSSLSTNLAPSSQYKTYP